MTTVNYEIEGAIARVTLNRPDKLNSFTKEMLAALADAFDRAAADGARALILTGSGRAFCAGQDLADLGDDDIEMHLSERYQPMLEKLIALPCPTVAAVNGVAAGAGANVALLCDLVFASDAAKFIEPFAKLGLVPDCGGTWTLPRLIGRQRAMGLALSAEPISASVAESWGLIWKCVPHDQLNHEVQKTAERSAGGPTAGFVATRKAFYAGSTAPITAQFSTEAKLQGMCSKTHDYREGVSAFNEKRRPEFTGR